MGMEWDSDREDSGWHTWQRPRLEDIVDQAIEVLNGDCSYPNISKEANPKIGMVLFVDNDGTEHSKTKQVTKLIGREYNGTSDT